jgi:hypothetical protein
VIVYKRVLKDFSSNVLPRRNSRMIVEDNFKREAEVVVLLGGITGLIFSAFKHRPSVDIEVLWNFVLWGLVIGPYAAFFALVSALIRF